MVNVAANETAIPVAAENSSYAAGADAESLAASSYVLAAVETEETAEDGTAASAEDKAANSKAASVRGSMRRSANLYGGQISDRVI